MMLIMSGQGNIEPLYAAGCGVLFKPFEEAELENLVSAILHESAREELDPRAEPRALRTQPHCEVDRGLSGATATCSATRARASRGSRNPTSALDRDGVGRVFVRAVDHRVSDRPGCQRDRQHAVESGATTVLFPREVSRHHRRTRRCRRTGRRSWISRGT